MDVRTWTTISRLLDDALDLPPAARDAWLHDLGPEHAGLRPQLEALLHQARLMDSAAFLATLPKFDVGSQGSAESDDDGPARITVGPYRLVRVLASGGQGSVWLAERADGVLTRPVALKLPHGMTHRPGLADRMTRERDILAALNHPHIARLYDAGVTAAGEPYLALEYVDGLPIDRYAAAHELGVAAVVRLFLQVVRAVAYAHGQLVIHRDLKPANTLVTGDGEARLLDFGIAKLLGTDSPVDSTLTVESGRALSLPYASPEQVRQEPLGVATDVYSLGVVLYELLTGVRPYDLPHESAAALEQAILAGEPRRASNAASAPNLRKALAGDLDTILAKALKKAPEARYPSAEALADDLERYLDGRPVLARPDSRVYQASKFIGRHRGAVAAAALSLVAVLTGAGVAVWQAQVARSERDMALRQEQRARASSSFLQSLLQQASPDRPLIATELLDRGTAQLDQAADMDPGVLAYLRYEISTHYLRFNQTDREVSLLVKSAEGARQAADFDLVAAAECAAAWSLAFRDLPAAQRRAAEGERALTTVDRPSFAAETDCLRARARVLEADGRVDEAIGVFETALPQLPPPTAATWTRLSLLRSQLSDLYRRRERFAEALGLSEVGLVEIRERGQAGTLNEFAAINNVASNLMRLGEVRDALALHRELLTWLGRGVFPVLPLATQSNLGFAELRMGDGAEALRLADAERTAAQRAGNPLQAAIADLLAARALLALGRPVESSARLASAERFWQTNPRGYARLLVEAALHRAELEAAAGDGEAARATVDQILASLDYPASDTAPGLDRALRLSARLHLEAGMAPPAAADASSALAISRRIARDERRSADVGESALLRARAGQALGRHPAAQDDARLSAEALTTGLGPTHATTVEAERLLATLSSAEVR